MEFDFSGRDPAEGVVIGELRLLQTLTEARNEHGMRQNEYERYRVYCTKKVHRLREIAKLTHVDDQHMGAKQNRAKKNAGRRSKRPTSAQQSEAAAKLGGNQFTKRTVTTTDVKDQTILLLMLFEAERNWAHSQELKTAAFEKDNDSRLFKQGTARARRAVQWASNLVDALKALSSVSSARSRLEAAAYLCIVRGSVSFDRSRHSESLQQTCVARELLSFLAQHSLSAKDEAFANSFVDAGDAQIRFSAYQLELDEQNLDVIKQGVADEETCEKWAPESQELMKEIGKASRKTSGTPSANSEIVWRGRTIHIRNPELLDAVTVARKEKELLEHALTQEVSEETDNGKNKMPAASAEGKRPRFKHSERNARRKAGEARRFRSSSTKTAMDPFDRALSAAADAERLAAQLVEDNAAALAKSHSSRYQAVNKELKAAHDYLLYTLLSLRIRRNDHLAKEVERKAERRERRARDAIEIRIKAAGRRITPLSGRKKRNNVEGKKKANIGKNPGSKAKKPRKQPKQFKRRPARGGTKRRLAVQAKARSMQLRVMAEEKSKRRRARAVPGLAKLLDAAEASLNDIAGLNLVETEPDVSSLIDAKTAWYRSELLRQLAKAYSLSRAYPHAILLINRAQLFIRQARSALDLAADIGKENRDIPPFISEQTLDDTDNKLLEAKHAMQKEMFSGLRKDAASSALPQAAAMRGDAMGETNAAAALRELANKYVDFDPALLEEAKRVPAEVLKALQSESRSEAADPAARGGAHEEEAFEDPITFEEAEAGDTGASDNETFEDPEDAGEAPDEETQGVEQKRGWFGGWLRRS
ncbi:hypothetical protein K437DRAFT_226583 [Tilletiaria anomala UBC 951]|uniref:Signal recognition particle subunit SRP68 n=1 Tax=Tilletiaria anomala (strain ATCC 24038 / CBS 436.72 / UBC 951) TaxID=1037660 RepID=A0A066VK05_TILAU|nr:uncharacterized protein K437DRAFT_226583 [Tilletiaria anomala UBC 951]KDN41791.1 hypothetical protein K437DRAFT_226583 [Tilletiaria anomala UBC 951]